MSAFVLIQLRNEVKIFNAMFSKVNGGLEQVFLNYTPALIEQGNTVIQIIHPDAEIRQSCRKEHLHLVHNYNQYDLLAIYRLRRLIKTQAPDCIITHSHRAAYLFNKTKTSVPKIAVCHVKGNYDFGSDAIIALTEQMRQDIIASGQPAERVFTVPNLIHMPKDAAHRQPKTNPVPVIGVCARLAHLKGVDVFIEALAELKRRKLPFKAKIAGDGKEKEQYIQLIAQHDLQQEVSLLGWIDDRKSFYDSIDIFCLPSREEAFGLVILEAMANSLPMVLSDLSGPREIVADSNSALLVSAENPIALADGLERMIGDESLRVELSAKAFARAQHYSSHNVGPMLHNVLQHICTRR